MRSKERVQKYAEVFTPAWLINQMLDIDKEFSNEIARIQSKVLEPSCGNGNFIIEILKRKFEGCEKLPKEKQLCGYITAVSSVYGVDILEDNIEETRHRITGLIYKSLIPCTWFKLRHVISEILLLNIVCGDTLRKVAFSKNHTEEDLVFYDWAIFTANASGKEILVTKEKVLFKDMFE